MAGELINVNSEIERMNNLIGDVSYCTSKIEELQARTVWYKTNLLANVFSILTTVYLLFCVISRNGTWKTVLPGLVLLLVVGYCIFAEAGPSHKLRKFFGVVFCCIILSIMVFVLELHRMTYIPWLILLANWGITVLSNLKLKERIISIAESV